VFILSTLIMFVVFFYCFFSMLLFSRVCRECLLHIKIKINKKRIKSDLCYLKCIKAKYIVHVLGSQISLSITCSFLVR